MADLRSTTEAAMGFSAGVAAADPKAAKRGAVVLVPEGYSIADLGVYDPLARPPHQTQRKVTLHSASAFVSYLVQFADEAKGQAIFADRNKPAITAILDYDTAETPAHGLHQVVYPLPYSEPWKTWMAINERWMSQRDLAAFLEENVLDVTIPDQADLLELVNELTIDRQRTFTGSVKAQQGTYAVKFDEVDKTSTRRGEITLWKQIKIRVPVYFRGSPVEQAFHFRYKLDDGKIYFQLAAHRVDDTLDQAFSLEVEAINVERPANMSLFWGAPPT